MEEQKEMDNIGDKNSDNKKIKNLISICILLGALFVGSLAIDVAQLVKGEGFSQRRLSEVDVVETAGKTWVAYAEPRIEIKVVTDSSCENCDPSEVLVWLRRISPTVSASKVEQNSSEGQALINKFGIKTIPAFIFSDKIKETDFYQRAQVLFAEKEKAFVLNTSELGLPVGKYLELPAINEDDIIMGKKDSHVTVVEFSDFQCPFCGQFNEVVKKIVDEYQDRVQFVYKHLPLDFHPQAENAALAAECANEQGKFLPYANKLFSTQKDWGEVEGVAKFKSYALQVGLNGGQFNKCLDSQKYKDKIDKNIAEAGEFGISGTPAIFINDQFKNGVINYEAFKAIIEEQLQK